MALVYKTLGSEALDHFYSGIPTPLSQAYRDGLALMRQNPTEISEAARSLEANGALPNNTADDLNSYWLGGPSGRDTERLIRRGYEQAIELASTNKPEPKPVETFVVSGASDRFELHICEGKHAVTVFMFVTEDRPYGSKRSGSRSWVMRAGGPGARADQEQRDREDPAVVTTQVSGVTDS